MHDHCCCHHGPLDRCRGRDEDTCSRKLADLAHEAIYLRAVRDGILPPPPPPDALEERICRWIGRIVAAFVLCFGAYVAGWMIYGLLFG